MSDNPYSLGPLVWEALAAEIAKYRASMAGFLRESVAATNDFLSTVDFDDLIGPIDQAKFDDDPILPIRRMSYLLIAKARLHGFAALCANKSSNIHSLAVQTRPVLECAGQVVSLFQDLLGKCPGAESRISRYIDADYYQTFTRLSKGQIDHDELLNHINSVNPIRKEPLRKLRKFRELEKVRNLEFGDNWYRHLSNCFYHSNLSALKGPSYYGGVRSCNTVQDVYAIAVLMDYLTHQVITMLLYAAMCPDDGLEDDNRFDKVAELLRKKTLISEGFRRKVISMAGQRDPTPTGERAVR